MQEAEGKIKEAAETMQELAVGPPCMPHQNQIIRTVSVVTLLVVDEYAGASGVH